MTKYGIKEMEFYCYNNNTYQALFTDENDEITCKGDGTC